MENDTDTMSDAVTQLQCAQLCAWVGKESTEALGLPFGTLEALRRPDPSQGRWLHWAVVKNRADVFLVFHGKADFNQLAGNAVFASNRIHTEWGQVEVHTGFWSKVESDAASIGEELAKTLRKASSQRIVICGHSAGGAYAVAAAMHLLAPGLMLGTCNINSLPPSCTLSVVTFGAPNLISNKCPDEVIDFSTRLKTQGLMRAWELAVDPVPALLSSSVNRVYDYYKPGWLSTVTKYGMSETAQQIVNVFVQIPDLKDHVQHFVGCLDVCMVGTMEDDHPMSFDGNAHHMDSYVQEVLAELLRSTDACDCALLQKYLSMTKLCSGALETNDRAICKRLAKGLEDSSSRQRFADALAHFGAAGAQELANLLQHRDSEVHLMMLNALGSMGEGAASQAVAVTERLKSSYPQCVRQAAADALGYMGSIGASHAPEVAAVLKDAHDDFRLAAIRTLSHMGSAGAAAVSANLKDADLRTRKACVESLGLMGEVGTAHAAAVAALLKDSDDSVRWSALQTLSKMGKAGANAAAERINDRDERVRANAIEVLGRIDTFGAEHVNSIAERLKVDDDDFVQRTAVEVLSRMDKIGAAALAALLQLHGSMSSLSPLGYSYSGTRVMAVKALGSMGKFGDAHAHAVAELLKDPVSSVQQAAMEALGCMDRDGMTAVAALLQDEDWRVRQRALNVLRNKGESAAVHASSVGALLKDPDNCVRLSAMKTLASMGGAGAAAAAKLLTDWNEKARQAAAEALGYMGQMAVIYRRELTECLKDPDPDTRWAARETLGYIGGAGDDTSATRSVRPFLFCQRRRR